MISLKEKGLKVEFHQETQELFFKQSGERGRLHVSFPGTLMERLSPSDLFRFGVFEVDLRVGELRKQGVKIKLQEQPFQVLALLLKHRGELITREELRRTLWTDDTFVDFDHSLSTAIGKIREALGDSAENPRFVETVARRGYRFVAPADKMETKPRQGSDFSSSAEPNATGSDIAGQGQIGAQLGLAPTPSETDTRVLPAGPATQAVQGIPSSSTGALRSRRSLPLILAAVLTIVAATLAGVAIFQHESTTVAAIHLSLVLPENLTFAEREAPVISPDGHRLALLAQILPGSLSSGYVNWTPLRPVHYKAPKAPLNPFGLQTVGGSAFSPRASSKRPRRMKDLL